MQTKINILLAFFLVGLCHYGLAQTQRVIVDAGRKPLIGVTIQLLRQNDSVLVNSWQSDSNGHYSFGNPLAGIFSLRFSYTGFQTRTISIQGVPDTLVMAATENLLREFVVRSSKPIIQQQAFGTSINVEKSILAKSSSVLEVLERSPGVAIDHRNLAISLNGSTGVMIMLNGQLLRLPVAQVMSMLESMPADAVARIDLMHTAPAGFDAEGTAGIIRIVTKQNKLRGTNGSVSATGGMGWAPKAGATLQITHNTRNWQLSGSYTYGFDRTYSDLWIDSHQRMPIFGGSMSVIVNDTSKATQQNHTGIASAYFTPDSTTTLGIQLITSKAATQLSVHDWSDYFLPMDSTLYFNSRLNSNNHWNNTGVGFIFDKRLKRQQTLSLRADYLYYAGNNPSDITTNIFNKEGKAVGQNDTAWAPQQRGYAQTAIDVLAEKIDYTKTFTDYLQLQTGIKSTQANSKSLSGIESWVNGSWVARNGALAQGRMTEWIGAAYVALELNSSKWKASISGRYEYAKTNLTEPGTSTKQAERTMGKFFPTVFISYQQSAKRQWQLSYTERISRPTYNDLASFVRYSDATSVYTGNPLLLPGISRQLKFGYTLSGQNILLSYVRNANSIAGYQLTESPDRKLLYVGPQNVQLSETIQAQWSWNQRINTWWGFSSSVAGSWNKFQLNYTPLPITHAYFRYNFSLTQNFTLANGYAAEISGWFNSYSFNGSTKASEAGSVSVGLKKDFMKDNSRLQLTISDLLRSEQYGNRYGTIGREAFDITNHVLYNVESTRFPIVKLTYTKSFGKGGSVKRKMKEATEENERIRPGN